jgi:hypothetical protein
MFGPATSEAKARTFRALMRKPGREFFAAEANLNLLTPRESCSIVELFAQDHIGCAWRMAAQKR